MHMKRALLALDIVVCSALHQLQRLPPTCSVVARRSSPLFAAAGEAADDEDDGVPDLGDWRDLRARLVAQEQQLQDTSESGEAAPGFVFESPLIEQGSVILGGTEQAFGFALRQQYFHKSVMLLLQHDDGFTKGIILNRPSAYEIDGWRVWFGGDVGEGGKFRGEKGKGDAEIVRALSSSPACFLVP